jgi:glutaredoxin 3
MPAKIVMYTKENCGYCLRAKSLLASKAITDINEIRVDLDSTQLEQMIKLSNGQRTVPQIFINNQHIGGFDNLAKLNQDGKLDSLLN